MTTSFKCSTAQLITPEFLRLLAIANHKENIRVRRVAAARRALAIANKLKNAATKKTHKSRIFSALNKLRAV